VGHSPLEVPIKSGPGLRILRATQEIREVLAWTGIDGLRLLGAFHQLDTLRLRSSADMGDQSLVRSRTFSQICLYLDLGIQLSNPATPGFTCGLFRISKVPVLISSSGSDGLDISGC
jgi:hypothetical protein